MFQSVGNQIYITLQNGMTAERHIPGRLTDIDALYGFEPLPVTIHQTDGRDRDIENLSRQTGNALESILSNGIKDIQGV